MSLYIRIRISVFPLRALTQATQVCSTISVKSVQKKTFTPQAINFNCWTPISVIRNNICLYNRIQTFELLPRPETIYRIGKYDTIVTIKFDRLPSETNFKKNTIVCFKWLCKPTFWALADRSQNYITVVTHVTVSVISVETVFLSKLLSSLLIQIQYQNFSKCSNQPKSKPFNFTDAVNK